MRMSITVDAELLAGVDKFIEDRDERPSGRITRNQAVVMVIRDWLQAQGYLALENDLELLPILNKIDLPSAEPDRIKEQIENIIGLDASDAAPEQSNPKQIRQGGRA